MLRNNQDDNEFELGPARDKFESMNMLDPEAGRFHAWLMRTGKVWEVEEGHREAYLFTICKAIDGGFLSTDGRVIKNPSISDRL